MKGKLLVIAFAVLAVIAGAFTFEPSVTKASGGIKPSATPRPRKVTKKPTTVFQGMNVNPVVQKKPAATNSKAMHLGAKGPLPVCENTANLTYSEFRSANGDHRCRKPSTSHKVNRKLYKPGSGIVTTPIPHHRVRRKNP